MSKLNDEVISLKQEIAFLKQQLPEENYRLIIENTTDVYYSTNKDGILLSVSPAAKELLLLDNHEDAIGRNVMEFYKNPSDRAALLEELEKNGKVQLYQLDLKRNDNSIITVEMNSKSIYGSDGEVDSIVGVLYDVTSRLEAETEKSTNLWFLERLDKVDNIIRTATGIDRIFNGVASTVIEDFQCDSALILSCKNEMDAKLQLETFVLSDNYTCDIEPDVFFADPDNADGMFNRILMYETHVFIDSDNINELSGISKKMGIRAQMMISINLASGNSLIFCINHCKDERTWNKHEKALLTEIANRLTDAINTFESTEMLFKSEEHHRRLIEATSEGYWEIDEKGTTTVANNAMCNMLGYAMNEFIGKPSLTFAFPGSRQLLEEQLFHPHDKPLVSFEVELLHKNGNRVYTLFNITRREDDNGNNNGAFFFVTDISNQKEVERKLKDSENQLRSLFNAMTDAVMEIDYEGKYIYFAPTKPDLMFLPTGDAIGKTFHDIFPEQQADQYLTFIRNCLDDNEPKSIEYPLEIDNNTYWFEGRAVPKTANTVMFIAHDITNRRKANHALRQSEKNHKELSYLLRKIIDTSPEMIWAKDKDGNFTITNEAIVKKLLNAKDVEESIGKHVMDFVRRERDLHPEDNEWFTYGEECGESDDIVINSKSPGQFDEYGNVFGEHIFLDVYKAPIFDDRGSLTGTVGFARDVTYEKKVELEKEDFRKELEKTNFELEELNQNLKDALVKAEESDRLKTMFIKNISHEVRTPLNGIIGFIDMLSNESLTNEERKEYTKYVLTSSNQLTTIVTDILEYSRLEAGHVEIAHKDFNLNYLLDELHARFSSFIASKNKTHLKFTLDKETPDHQSQITADKVKVRQIFTSLISNAIKFTNEGEIRFGYKLLDNGNVRFYVVDTGIGIPENDKEIIFEKFRHGSSINTALYGGNGLGLTISRSLTKLLGGHIWFESEVGVGSKFYVTMPISKSRETVNKKYIVPEIKSSFDWTGKKVLIVDDVFEVFKLISIYLRNTKAIQLYAKNGAEAIELCKQDPDIDIVLLDIQLPDIDGYEIKKTIKSMRKELPIIAQTAFALSDDKEKALSAGFDAYIAKPIYKNTLLELMDEFL